VLESARVPSACVLTMYGRGAAWHLRIAC